MPQNLQKLLVRIEGDMSGLRGALAGSQAQVSQFTGTIKSSFNTIRGAFGAIGIGIGIRELFAFGKQALASAAEIGELAQQVGLSAEAFQELRFAAKQSGVEQAQLEAILKKLSISAGDAANGVKSAADAFKDMNISVLDSNGKVKANEQLILELAQGYSEAEDKTKFLAHMQDVLGRNVGALIPLFQGGASALNDFAKEARETGQVLSDDIVKAADDAGDALEAMFTRINNLATIGAAELLKFLGLLDRTRKETIDIKIGVLEEKRATLEAMLKGAPTGEREFAMRKSLTELTLEIEELKRQKAALENPPPITTPTLPGGGDGEDGDTKKKKSLKEQESALADLIGTQQIELQLLQMTARERAIEEAAIRASDAAMRDEAAGLRDSPLLRKEESDAIRAKAAALYDLAEAQRVAEQAARDAERAERDQRRETEDLTRSMNDFARSAVEAGDDIGKWTQLFLDNLDDIANAIIKLGGIGGGGGGGGGLAEIFTSIIGAIIGGIGGGIGSGNVVGGPGFGTARAGGGPVRKGAPYWVGEPGPELFVPGEDGRIFNKGQMRGARDGPAFFIDARNADREGLARLERMILSLHGSIEKRAVNAMFDERRRGGSVMRDFR